MRKPFRIAACLLPALIFIISSARAQDVRVQYPPLLRNSYFGVNIGSVYYPFSAKSMEPGFTAESIHVPHVGVRIILFGHQFNKWLSAQISYMRPVGWVEFKNVNNSHQTHTVWMNISGITMGADIPLAKKLSLYTEGGLALMMRRGFYINDTAVVKDAAYATTQWGGTLQYHINKKWDLHAGLIWSPRSAKNKQPATSFYSVGFNLNMRTLPEAKVKRSLEAGYHFPRQMIFAGFCSNVLSYGVNRAVSEGPVPIFWGGDVKVRNGFTINYQRNVYHARKVFALDWGVNAAVWTSRINHQFFYTLSAYPAFRFNFIRKKSADYYAEWSVAGPTYISQYVVDGIVTGKHFTFQDVMGIGMFTGKKRNLQMGLRISHFSNGNLFTNNGGFMVPLTMTVGYAFP